MSTDRLTALDASFVWFECPGAPVHVGAVATFEAGPLLDGRGRLRLGELQDALVTRLGAVPRLRRRLARVPLGIDRPCWVDDPGFDVTRHVGEIRLAPPGDDDSLLRLAADLQSEILPRDRPLWDLRFVTGLSGGRVGLVERVHHALVDGVSGVDLAALLLDLTPDAPRPADPEPWSPRPPGALALMADGLRDRAEQSRRIAGAVAGALRHPSRAVRSATTVTAGVASLARGGLAAPRTSLGNAAAGPRRLAVVRTTLAGTRAAAAEHGATLNDVVLSAVAGGLRWLLAARGVVLPADLVVRVLVPVSLRRPDEHGTLGNRVGSIVAPLPIGIGDPRERLDAVARSMRRLKGGPQSASTGLLLDAADLLPLGAARLVTGAMARQRLVDVVVTNVPGSPVPLYLAGARLLEAFPVVPLAAGLPVGVAVMSYDGQLALTLTGEERACPDLDTFAVGIERSLARLGVGDVGEARRVPAPM